MIFSESHYLLNEHDSDWQTGRTKQLRDHFSAYGRVLDCVGTLVVAVGPHCRSIEDRTCVSQCLGSFCLMDIQHNLIVFNPKQASKLPEPTQLVWHLPLFWCKGCISSATQVAMRQPDGRPRCLDQEGDRSHVPGGNGTMRLLCLQWQLE